MPRVSVEPSIKAASHTGNFLQTVLVNDKGKPVGRGIWSSSSTQPGTIQILCIEVPPANARQGIGSAIMDRIIQEAHRRAKLMEVPLRRVWIVVEQKTQIAGRGFLTRHGFHHVKTLDSLLKGEAAMVYVRSFT
jgi:ribosomal protein S18 acetylase RimI-like enzyme